jgi:hypothetical protein
VCRCRCRRRRGAQGAAVASSSMVGAKVDGSPAANVITARWMFEMPARRGSHACRRAGSCGRHWCTPCMNGLSSSASQRAPSVTLLAGRAASSTAGAWRHQSSGFGARSARRHPRVSSALDAMRSCHHPTLQGSIYLRVCAAGISIVLAEEDELANDGAVCSD